MRKLIRNNYIGDIRSLVSQGFTHTEIASKLPISKNTVFIVCKENGIKRKRAMYSRNCQHCLICYSTYHIGQKFCSPFCSLLHKKSLEKLQTVKTCSDCGLSKPLIEFSSNKLGKLGLHSQCRSCKNGTSRTNRSTVEYRTMRNANDKLRAKTDPKFHLNRTMRVGVYMSLSGNKRNTKWEKLVGYTLPDLKRHLEKRFKPGMSWDNFGKWHIDHIIPKSIFNFSSPDHIDFKRCWALSNLQPLWGPDNIAKNNKIAKPFQPSLELAA